MVKEKKIFLLNGQIISSKTDKTNEVIKFEQLNIDLTNLTTTTIKKPKIQETSTLKLLSCFLAQNIRSEICSEDLKKRNYSTIIKTYCFTILYSNNFFNLFIITTYK